MDALLSIFTTILDQLQKPTLAFLIGGMLLAACGSKLTVPDPVYKFVVMLLLLKVGLGAGISVREANLAELIVPAILAAAVGVGIVLLGRVTIARRKGVSEADGMATAGLFGAVSASTLAAGMAILDDEGIAYEGFIGALYPFMDVAALVTAIVIAKVGMARNAATRMQAGWRHDGDGRRRQWRRACGREGPDRSDPERHRAICGHLGPADRPGHRPLRDPDSVYDSFYEPLFRGLLSILMLVMGMEAWSRLSELRKVAGAYVSYGLLAPLVHGLLGLGAGLIAHHLTGFSQGGMVLLAVMAASSSDISGPPTMRGALPEANPSAYIGASTGLGTPVAILAIPLWIALAELAVG